MSHLLYSKRHDFYELVLSLTSVLRCVGELKMSSESALDLGLVEEEKKGLPLAYDIGERALWPLAVLPMPEPAESEPSEANYWLLGPMRRY